MKMERNQYQEFMDIVVNKNLYFIKPYPKNDNYFHIMWGGELVCEMDFRNDNLMRDTLSDIQKYFLIRFTDNYDKVKRYVASHAREVKQDEQANEEEETAGA